MTEESNQTKSIILTGNGTESTTDHEISYFDKADTRSLYNIAPEGIRDMLQEDKVLPQLLKMDEKALKKMLKPSAILSRIRIAFWKEYERAQIMKSNMRIDNCYRGICTREFFMDAVARNVQAVAWILRPTTNYVVAMEEALNHGIERMREILDFPLWEMKEVKSKDGQRRQKKMPNYETAKLVLKTVQMLDTRVKGASVQRVHQRIDISSSGSPRPVVPEKVEDHLIEARIKELEDELNNHQGVHNPASKNNDDYTDYREVKKDE